MEVFLGAFFGTIAGCCVLAALSFIAGLVFQSISRSWKLK